MGKSWEQNKIGQLFSKSTEKGKNGIPILSVSIHFGVSSSELDDEDLGKFVRRSEDKSLYLKVDPGDVVLNMMRAWQGGIGVSRSLGMVSPAYIVAKPSIPFDSNFLNELIRSHEMIQKIDNLSYGVTDFRKRLYWKSFSQIDLKFPNLKEQTKIGNLIQKFDDLIDLEQHQLDLLKEQKKGFLQKMFPKDGSNVPEIRFPGFTAPWEQRKLGEIGKARSGVGFPENEQGGSIGIPFFKVSDMNSLGNEREMITANNYVSQSQIVSHKWTPIEDLPAIFFAKVGAAVMLNRKRLCRFPFLLDNNSMAYSLNKTFWDPNFAQALFETIDLTSLVQIGALPSYNAKDIEAISINLPTLLEQVYIGSFFSNLDDLITLHQRKLEFLKEQKKGLLQKMFPKEGEDAPKVRFPEFR